MNQIQKSAAILLDEYLSNVPDDWNYILPEQLHKIINSDEVYNYFLLDTRKPEDYAKGHIPGAINIYWLYLMDYIDQIPMDKTIVIICYLGHTASQLLPFMSLMGFNVKALKFGMGLSPIKGVQIKGWRQYKFEEEKL